MRMTYRFVDGSIDDETTTYMQQGTFRLIQDHHIEKGPFFSRPIDFTVDAGNGIAISRTTDKNGRMRVESKHIKMPNDLANGIVGTLLLNVSNNTTPFREGMLAPVGGGRLIQLLISSEGEQTVRLSGQTTPGDGVSHPSRAGGHRGDDRAADRPSAKRCDGMGAGGRGACGGGHRWTARWIWACSERGPGGNQLRKIEHIANPHLIRLMAMP